MLTLWVTTMLLSAAPLSDDVSYQEGLRLYEDFEYEKAVFRFKAALRVPDRSDADQATVLIRLGMTYAELRDVASAAEAFDQAVAKDPLASLPLDASPKIQLLLDEARQRARQKRQAEAATPPPPPDPAGPADDGAPAPDEIMNEPQGPGPTPAADADDGMPLLLIGGAATAGLGVAAALVGAGLWGGGVGLASWASGQTYQDQANAYALPSAALQVGGQAALGVGAVVLLGGAALAVVGVLVE